MNLNKGASLLLLVIALIIVVVASVIFFLIVTKEDILADDNEFNFKSNATTYKNQLDSFMNDKYLESTSYKHIDENYHGSTLRKIIPSIKNQDFDKFAVVDGELIFIGKNDKEKMWSKEIGILVVEQQDLSIESIQQIYYGSDCIVVETKMNKSLEHYKFEYTVIDEYGTKVLTAVSRPNCATDIDELKIYWGDIKRNHSYILKVEVYFYNCYTSDQVEIKTYSTPIVPDA